MVLPPFFVHDELSLSSYENDRSLCSSSPIVSITKNCRCFLLPRKVKEDTEERVVEVINEFLKDFKGGPLADKGWPLLSSAYMVSKAAMNAYTRIAAKKCPNFKINCLCPGFVKTDINCNTGTMAVEEGAEIPVRPTDDGPSGVFFERNGVSSFE